jgi:ABC-type transport system involved in multi-copper enzyme maturation permease subunit
MNLQRIWAIGHNVFRETLRDRILYLILVYLIVITGASLLLPDVSNTADFRILLDLGLSGLNFLGLIVAIFVGTGLVNKEIEKRTVYLMIAKPMTRTEFILGKHLGLSAMISVLVAVMAGIYFLAIVLQSNPGTFAQPSPIPYLSLLWAMVFIQLELTLIVAAGLMFGVFTSSILATLYTIALYIVGHLSELIRELAKLSESDLLKQVLDLVYFILPNLERLNLRNEAIYGQLPSLSEILGHGLYGLVYTSLLLTVATFIFARRQF